MSKEASAPGQPGAGAATQAESAPPPPAAPAPSEESAYSMKDQDESGPSTLSQALSEFDRARLELSQLLGRELAPIEIAAGSATAGAPRDAPKSQAPAAAESSRSRAESEDRNAEPAKKADGGCVTVCRAFDSLTRSAAAVCRLDEGERCRKANSVVAVARDDAGVKACACKR